MSKRSDRRPTVAEMEVLRSLWRTGRAPVAAIRNELATRRELSVTTVATHLSVLVTKGLVRRYEDDPKRHEFEAIISEDEAGRGFAAELRDRIFGGSLRSLVRHAFKGPKPTDAELAELDKLIRDAREEK